jgi:Zn-dependent protease
MEQLITIIALIISIILHEMAHGYAANALGDPTARLQGRLSGNPLVHIDPLGSIIIPGILLFSNVGILFGWAKPVPYNPYNLNNQKWGEALVALAGPATNVLLAVIFAVIVRSADSVGLSDTFVSIAGYIVYINVLLAMFNMLPIPPLDGSKILVAVLPYGAQLKYRQFARWVEQYGLLAMFAFIFIFVQLIATPFFGVVSVIVRFLTGG